MTKDEQLIEYHITNKSPVIINYNDDAGTWQYSVQVEGTELWLDSFDNINDAMNFCFNNELPIVSVKL